MDEQVMVNYDVFNGDTDGIFARHQLRLAIPLDTVNISGVKRDVNLLRHVKPAKGDLVTVMDISHAKNRKDVLRILESGARVEYFDHHDPSELIDHPNITYHIDTDPHMTTGRIVDSHVNGKNHIWAVATAFGDNHFDLAYELATAEGLDHEKTKLLKEIGLAINYNSYGKTEKDLFAAPLLVSEMLEDCGEDVFAISEHEIFSTLVSNFRSDMSTASCQEPYSIHEKGVIYKFPDEEWSHRIMGTFGNHLVNSNKDLACAIAVTNSDKTYRVSVRSSLNNPYGAGNLCKAFGGGGREKAGGINNLEERDLDKFKNEFGKVFS